MFYARGMGEEESQLRGQTEDRVGPKRLDQWLPVPITSNLWVRRDSTNREMNKSWRLVRVS